MSHTITLHLSDEQFQELEQESHSSGKSIDTLVEETFQLGRKMYVPYGHFRKFAGYFQSPVSDMAQRHDEYLQHEAANKHIINS